MDDISPGKLLGGGNSKASESAWADILGNICHAHTLISQIHTTHTVYFSLSDLPVSWIVCSLKGNIGGVYAGKDVHASRGLNVYA